jgi:tRNA modification GTPase
MHYILADTIVALSTPSGHSALAVIRLSGPHAIRITNEIFKGTDLEKVPSHTVHYGWIKDTEDHDIDEVMVAIFRAPRSFTTEDSTEISCHGSPHIARAIITAAVQNGARIAQPGEFTLRAFMNGRLDLSQAEAVADLIESATAKSSEMALNQLKGHFSSRLKDLRQELIDFAALIELELDFSEEDVEFAHRGRLKELVHKIIQVINPLIDSFRWGNSIKEGIPVAIIGAPNAGKSTLLNTILNEEKALVSDIAGTTRDFIEDTLVIDGIAFRFIDTAGLRETSDKLEGLGIERSRQKLREAEIIFYLSDIHRDVEVTVSDYKALELTPRQTGVVLLNKADTIHPDLANPKVEAVALKTGTASYLISARDRQTLGSLFDFLNEYIREHNQSEGTVISNSRHNEALENTKKSLQRVLTGIASGISSDFIAMDIREALFHLGTITGEVSTDDLLESIFSKFCIGK